MRTFKYYTFVAALVLVSVLTARQAKAQYVQDINGRVYQTKSFADIEGSPYLAEAWLPGSVKLTDGRVYKDILLKFNAIDGNVYFKGKTDDDYIEFVDPVAEFAIQLVTLKRFIKATGPDGAQHYYEVLADGTKQLLKQPLKEIREEKPYSGPAIKKIIDADKYFLATGKILVPVKKDKKALLAALGDKQPELDAFIKANKLDLKKDEDAIKLVIYYNSL